MTAERDREIQFAKQKSSKLLKDLDLAKSETIKLVAALHVFQFN